MVERRHDCSDELLEEIGPSQWLNAPYIIGAVVSILVLWSYSPLVLIAVVPPIWNYLEIKFWRYELREMTIIEKKGVLDIEKTENHYYRIKSIRVERSLIFRILGLTTIEIISSDKFKPRLTLYAIKDGDRIHEWIKNIVYDWKREMGVKDYDVFNTN